MFARSQEKGAVAAATGIILSPANSTDLAPNPVRIRNGAV